MKPKTLLLVAGVLVVLMVTGGLLWVALRPSTAATAVVEPTNVAAEPTEVVLEPTEAPTALPDTPTPEIEYPLPGEISGTVVELETEKSMAGALVQIQGTSYQAVADQSGAFQLTGLQGLFAPATITAWSDGYFVGWAVLDPKAEGYDPTQPVRITLKPLYETDNLAYDWFDFDGVEGTASCGLCHREYPEWQADAHSQAALNPRFLSIYRGTDIHGNQSQPVRLGSEGVPLPPDPALPYYGAGYRLDNPLRAGNCASCHTPIASKISNATNCGWSGCHTDITAERAPQVDYGVLSYPLSGDAAEGISCDFCHKIGGVILNPETQLPYPDMPGILSLRLFRPEEGQQVFFGTVLDVSRRVSYMPLQSESAFCAACHYGVFGGVVGHGQVSGGTLIYNSYGEWLDSPYSDPESGMTCQQCHMPVSEANYFVFPEQGGLERDYVDLHDHRMPGAADVEFLQNAVSMSGTAVHEEDRLRVEVSIFNDRTGHHIPTDAPMRQMILVVEAFDADGNPLVLVDGPRLPDYAGDLADFAGKSFAKVLRDEWSGETPTAAYWRPVTIVEDTRLAALATDTSQYLFDLPVDETAEVHVRLIFRRTFQSLAEQKGWDDPDILMEEALISVEESRK